jgi:hypothetical protein
MGDPGGRGHISSRVSLGKEDHAVAPNLKDVFRIVAKGVLCRRSCKGFTKTGAAMKMSSASRGPAYAAAERRVLGAQRYQTGSEGAQKRAGDTALLLMSDVWTMLQVQHCSGPATCEYLGCLAAVDDDSIGPRALSP